MSILLAKAASDALLTWLKTALPAQITALNGQSPVAYGGADGSAQVPITLDAIRAWTDHALVAQAPTPVVYVLPQSTALRTPNQTAELDQAHEFLVCFEVGDPDQGIAHAKCLYYVAAFVRAVVSYLAGQSAGPAGCTLLLGHEGNEQLVQWGVTPDTTTPAGLYEFAKVAVTAFSSELP